MFFDGRERVRLAPGPAARRGRGAGPVPRRPRDARRPDEPALVPRLPARVRAAVSLLLPRALARPAARVRRLLPLGGGAAGVAAGSARASRRCARAPGGGWTVTLAGGEEHGARAVVLGVGSVPALPGCARALLGERRPAQRRLRRRSASASLRRAPRDGDRLGPERGGGRRRPARRTRRARGSTGSRAAPASCRWSTPSSGSSTSRPSTRRTSTACRRRAATRCAPGRTCSTRESRRARASGSTTRCTARSIDGAERRHGATPRAASCASSAAPPTARCGSCCATSTPDAAFTHATDVLVLGTGYRAAPLPVPALAELAALDERGRPVIEADHRVRLRDGGAVDALRAERRPALARRRRARPRASARTATRSSSTRSAGARSIAVRERNVFQTFGVPPGAAARASGSQAA